MPLPFLTADRNFGEFADSAGDGPLPYADHDSWRRPYRLGPWRVLAASLDLLIVSYLLFAAMIMVLAGSAAGALTCAAFALVGGVAALRLLRMGIWVSAHGLRQVGLLYTTTLPWDRIASVRTVQQPVRWLGLPRTVQGQALVVTPAGSHRSPQEPLRPLLTSLNADFLARPEAFERAADTIEAWAAELR